MENLPEEKIEESSCLKIKTCSNIKEELKSAIAGELFLVTGQNAALYICGQSASEEAPAGIYKLADINPGSQVI